jgi:cytidylate kinase
MIVTIDGPAGAGKSSAARALAQRLDFEFLDTGAMYRAVTLAVLRVGCDLDDADRLSRLLDAMRLEMPPGRVLLDGDDVTRFIRTPQINGLTGATADNAMVRRRLVALQRAIAVARNFVTEGRDQGTIVFPDAICKFFLVADPVERARRRHREMLSRGQTVSFEEVLAAQEDRDARDAARSIAPMVPAADAILLDSTALTPDQVVAAMDREVRKRMAGTRPAAKDAE